MNYIVNEKDISATVSDFLAFCDFIEATKLFVTAKGNLSTKGYNGQRNSDKKTGTNKIVKN